MSNTDAKREPRTDRYSTSPREVAGRRLVPINAAPVLPMSVTSMAYTFGHRGVEYFEFAPGLLFRVAGEDEEPMALFPVGSVRPSHGVPLIQVAIVDVASLTPEQLAGEQMAITEWQGRTVAV